MNNILIIYTGGTIGMVNDPKTGVLLPFDFEQITDNVPELERLNYKLTVHSFQPIIDSSNMQPAIWVELATLIEKNYELFDGFVVLHGSDTMAYTASALSFMLENLSKPVVLTGSQLPIGEIRTDAKENLITALEIASWKRENGKAMVPEVSIYFDYQLFRGNRAIKYHSIKFEAFRSPNYTLLAEAGVHLKFNENYIMPANDKPLKLNVKLNPNIGILKIYPGISPAFVKGVILSEVDAIVLETFGSGNTTTERWFTDCLQQAIDSGKLLLDISQCKGGSVELGRYETSRPLLDMGVVSGYDMTFEAAVTKLMHVLGNEADRVKQRTMLESNLRGELTRNGSI